MTGPRIDRSVVEHLATLSSISLSPAEADQMVGELASIVAYVEQLGRVDTSEVAEAIEAAAPAWREDVVVPGLSREEALREAPEASDDGFAVPTFVTVTSGTRVG